MMEAAWGMPIRLLWQGMLSCELKKYSSSVQLSVTTQITPVEQRSEF
jgi:hypothetical protein